MTFYRTGLYKMNPQWWDTAPVLSVVLLDAAGTYSFDVEDMFVADLVPGSNELVTDNYTRPTSLVISPAYWNAVDARWELPAATITFPDLGPVVGPPTVGGVVVFEPVTDDSDSPLLIHQATSQPLDSTDLTVTIDPTGVVRVVEV